MALGFEDSVFRFLLPKDVARGLVCAALIFPSRVFISEWFFFTPF